MIVFVILRLVICEQYKLRMRSCLETWRVRCVRRGGLYLAGAATYLTNCTVSVNQAKGLSGGIVVPQDTFNVVLVNTIVAGNTENTGIGYSEQFVGADISGSADAHYSLIGNRAGWTSLFGADGDIV